MIGRETELMEKIDLHYGRRDFSENKNYVEFSFYACFYELLNIENSSWETNLNGNEIFEILTSLNVDVSRDFLGGGGEGAQKSKFFDGLILGFLVKV